MLFNPHYMRAGIAKKTLLSKIFHIHLGVIQ